MTRQSQHPPEPNSAEPNSPEPSATAPNATTQNSTAAGPIRLSLAVAAPGVTPRDLERFLASRAGAGVGPRDEVIIAASPASADGARELAAWIEAQSPPAAPLSLALHPAGTTPMRLWGFAMSRAKGQHVAVLDARDTLAEGWVAAWADACALEPDSIVCGPVDPGQLEDSCSWAAYLSEYARFWTPLSGDDLDEAPGNNIVFPRASLPAPSELESDGFWKTFHLEKLRENLRDTPHVSQRGGSSSATSDHASLALAVSPGMVVRVERRYRLAEYLRRRYLHGRCYGGTRLEQPGAPPRLLCLGFTPLLPWVRTARVLSRLASRARNAAELQPARSWPRAALGPLVLGEIAWSWGELAGYARGSGTACEELW